MNTSLLYSCLNLLQVYRLNKVLTHQNIKGWWISKTKTYLAGLKKCFSFLSVNYAQRSCCKLHAPYNSLKKYFFSISIDHLWPNSSQIRGHKNKLLPSSYSNGALKMCNICFCKYCARICFKAICILLIFDKISFLIQIEQNKPWCIKIRRVGRFYKKKNHLTVAKKMY